MITQLQFARARALAFAHSHEWGTAPLTPTLPAPAEAVAAAIEVQLDPDRSWPGLGFATAHTTGTGRLAWDVSESGSVDLWVRRPGSALTALRALERAAADAYHHAETVLRHASAAPDLRALLTGLCGEYLAYGSSAATDSPVGQGIAALRQGVTVLYADVASDGAVTVIETTREEVASDLDAAELRHWMVLRDALRALGLSLPADTRPEVTAALAAADEAGRLCSEAAQRRDALYRLPEAEQQAPAWQERLAAATAEADTLYQAAERACAADIRRRHVEMARRVRGADLAEGCE